MNDDYVEMIKTQILVCGDPAVGKTSLIRRFVDDTFEKNYIETVGADLSIKDQIIPVKMENGTIGKFCVRLKIYDIGGQKQFASSMLKYATTSQIFIICYDISDPKTFYNVPLWMNKIHERVNIDRNYHTIILVGTKDDLLIDNMYRELPRDQLDRMREYYNQVPISRMIEMLRYIGASYGIETSALNGDNVNLLFDYISKVAYNNFLSLKLNEISSRGMENRAQSFIKSMGFYPEFLQL